MSRKPTTPGVNNSPDNAGNEITAIRPGRRYSSNTDILQMEAALVADGVDLENRAIPVKYHPEKRAYDDPAAIRELIEAELDSEHPNRALIGLLNQQLAGLDG